MSIGTKSILFGVHQFFLHPFFVCISWRLIYGNWPSIQEAFCILFHDIGYVGKPNMDGNEGSCHPEMGAKIVRSLFGQASADMVLFHSRVYATRCGKNVSRLCLPDKLAVLLYPNWLYIILGSLSGEIREYKQRMGMMDVSDIQWLYGTKALILSWADRNIANGDRTALLMHFAKRVPLGWLAYAPTALLTPD